MRSMLSTAQEKRGVTFVKDFPPLPRVPLLPVPTLHSSFTSYAFLSTCKARGVEEEYGPGTPCSSPAPSGTH